MNVFCDEVVIICLYICKAFENILKNKCIMINRALVRRKKWKARTNLANFLPNLVKSALSIRFSYTTLGSVLGICEHYNTFGQIIKYFLCATILWNEVICVCMNTLLLFYLLPTRRHSYLISTHLVKIKIVMIFSQLLLPQIYPQFIKNTTNCNIHFYWRTQYLENCIILKIRPNRLRIIRLEVLV